MMSQGNHDYATELLSQCVLGDPSNLSYVQSYLGNLQKKYNNNKTGGKLAQLKERGARSAVKKAKGKGRWDDVIKNGLKVLAVNPWDVPTLRAMATASDELEADEPELYYLNAALNVDPKNPAVNRHCAKALATRDQFDQAIACWHRVQQALPEDVEARKQIANLAVEQTIKKGRYEEKDEDKKFGSVARSASQHESQDSDSTGGIPRDASSKPAKELSLEVKLRQQIDQQPEELSNYYELAQLHSDQDDFKAAEELLTKALDVSNGDPAVRSRLDDVQIRRLGKEIMNAEDEETKKKLRKQYMEKQLDYRKGQCELYPNNVRCKFDLGVAYQSTKQYSEAIRELQQAKNDPNIKGVCLLHLGQCFQQIKQYRLAISHYESAILGIPDRDADNKKKALYLVGKLAFGLKDLDKAEEHLTHLAEIDFAHKDVSSLLDKIREMRDNE
ncbi:MAG: hypothetical protein V3R99_09775 [Thermoguttaceae bacterium]